MVVARTVNQLDAHSQLIPDPDERAFDDDVCTKLVRNLWQRLVGSVIRAN